MKITKRIDLESEIDALRKEVERLRVEARLSQRNMANWERLGRSEETRADAAEADNARLKEEIKRLRTWQVGLVEMEKEKDNANLRADAAEAKLVEVRGLYTGLKDFDLIEVQKLQAILNRAEPEKGENK